MHRFGNLACIASLALSAQDFSGTWKIWANYAGEDRVIEIHLRQSGASLSGTVPATNQAIQGSAIGRTIEFTRSGGGLRVPQQFRGYRFQAGAPATMAGTFSHEGVWEYGWYGVQVTASAPASAPQISGTWNDDGKPASITQDAANTLVFTNRNGLRSTGRFADAATVIATQWEGGLHGKLTNNNTTIQWANGTVWSRPTTPQISGTWNDDGKPASITQDAANGLVFTNRNGLRSAGRFADATTVIATQWEGGLHGKLTNNNTTIQWANGTVWSRPAPSTFPWIGGGWADANQPATVEQDFNDRTKLVFVNRMGWRSKGTFVNATTVVASEWEGGLRGALVDNGETIRWANGTVWYRKVR